MRRILCLFGRHEGGKVIWDKPAACYCRHCGRHIW